MCYRFFDSHETWEEARKKCQASLMSTNEKPSFRQFTNHRLGLGRSMETWPQFQTTRPMSSSPAWSTRELCWEVIWMLRVAGSGLMEHSGTLISGQWTSPVERRRNIWSCLIQSLETGMMCLLNILNLMDTFANTKVNVN